MLATHHQIKTVVFSNISTGIVFIRDILTHSEYDKENWKKDPISILKYLMKEQGLKQVDLKEIGSQGVVSEILSGKRLLNTRQVKLLSKRFHVSPAVFV